MNNQINITNNNAVMKLENINKSYINKNKNVHVLENVSADFCSGKFYAIMGHSGSGKTTLINILGAIDSADSGSYKIYGTEVSKLNDVDLCNLRMKNIGFIFQGFYLNPTLKAYENVMVPMLINREINYKERKERAIELLKSVGLENRIEHYPRELSGGEQQRVAIARSLANDPSIILADEPTGNLDEKSEREVFELLKDLSQKDKCIVVVSHSKEVEKYADIICMINEGKLGGGN